MLADGRLPRVLNLVSVYRAGEAGRGPVVAGRERDEAGAAGARRGQTSSQASQQQNSTVRGDITVQ